MASYTYQVNLTPSINGSGTISFTSQTLTIATKDKYVLEDIVVTGKANTITNTSLPQGTLKNDASTGVEYTENTSNDTIIPSGGYLYINHGWFNDTKISLSHLIPEIASNDAGVGHIRVGYKAYTETGALLTGTMPDQTPTFTGGTVSVTPSVTALTVPTVTHSATGKLLPSGTGNVGGTYGVTTSALTGTEGTDFLTIDCTHSITNGSVKAYASANRTAVTYSAAVAGYVNVASGATASAAPSSDKTATSNASTITPTVTDNFSKLYIPIVSETITGGAITVTAGGSVTAQPAFTHSISSIKSGTSDATLANYGISATTTTGGASGYLTFVSGGSYSANGSVNATASGSTTAVHDKHGAGLIEAHDADIVAAQSGSNSKTINLTPTKAISSSNGAYRMPIVTVAGTGGGVSKTGSTPSLITAVDDVTLSHSGKFTDTGASGVGTSYGVHSGTPSSGADGTDYLKITTSGSGGTVSTTGSVSIAYSRAAVTTSSAYKGAVSMSSGASLLSAGTGSLSADVSSSGTANITGGATYYIDIVSPQGTGGGVSKSSGSGSVSGTAPTATLTTNGTLPGKTAYGVKTNQPSGTDGTDYFTVQATGSSDSQDFTGTATINYTRAAVTSNAKYQGAVNIASGDQLLASTTGNLTHTLTKKTVSASITNGTKYYIPIVSASATGGGLSAGTATVTGTGNIQASAALNLRDRNGSTEGSSAVDSTYGVITTAPTSGHYVAFNSIASSSSTKTVSVSVPVNRAAVSISCNPGITSGGGTGLGADSINATGSGTVGVTSGSTSKYIPVVSASASGGGLTKGNLSVTGTGNITVTPSTSFKTRTNGSDGSTAITESTYGITGSPANTGTYIIVDPGASAGAAKTVSVSQTVNRAAVTITCGAGITAGGGTGIDAGSSTVSGSGEVGTSIAAGANKYIPVVSASASGGSLSTETASVTGTGDITVTPSVIVKNSGGSNVESTYGVTTTQPSGTYVKLDPDASAGVAKTVTVSQTVNRAAVSVSCDPGITAGGGTGIAAGSISAGGSGTVGTSIAAGTNKFIPVVSPSADVKYHTIVNPTVTSAQSTSYKISGTAQTIPSGILTSQPSDFTTYSGGYLVFEPSNTITEGSSKTKGKATISKGITSGSDETLSSESSKSVSVSITQGTYYTKYIKVFDPTSYTIS